MHHLLLTGGLLLLILVQPWFNWPNLSPDISHRLTLVGCLTWMGLSVCCRRVRETVPLPSRWRWVGFSAMAMILTHQWPITRSGSYFEAYHESAAMADGLLVLVACLWGVWAAGQSPVAWLRRLRWAGFCLLVANLIAVLAQGWGSFPPWSLPGILGNDRGLGAYAVAWFPICWAWNAWFAILPLTLVVASGKTTAWVGVIVAIGCLRPRKWRLMMIGACLAAALLTNGTALLDHPLGRLNKIHQRLITWGPVLRATLDHPIVGHGFSPMAYPNARRDYGAWLPAIHSDWLAVAFHAGWIVFGVAVWAWTGIICAPAIGRWASALRASLCAIGAMSFGQSVVSQPRVAGVILLLLAWWWVETRTKECRV